ncbi:MAG: hypothetical protein JW822_06750 [Spirochaetales bacterium]|nr:hypothetical protein [Spirochaetales bacterium]
MIRIITLCAVILFCGSPLFSLEQVDFSDIKTKYESFKHIMDLYSYYNTFLLLENPDWMLDLYMLLKLEKSFSVPTGSGSIDPEFEHFNGMLQGKLDVTDYLGAGAFVCFNVNSFVESPASTTYFMFQEILFGGRITIFNDFGFTAGALVYSYPEGDIDEVLAADDFEFRMDKLLLQVNMYNFNVITLFDVHEATFDVIESNYIFELGGDYGMVQPSANYNNTLRNFQIGAGYRNLRLFRFIRLGSEVYVSVDTEDTALRFDYAKVDVALDLLALLLSAILEEDELEKEIGLADEYASYVDLYFNNSYSYNMEYDAYFWGFEFGFKINLFNDLAIVDFGFARSYRKSYLFIPDSWELFFRLQFVYGKTVSDFLNDN